MSRAWSCLLHAWACCWAYIHSFFDATLVFLFALTILRPNGHSCLMNLLVLGAHYGLADPESCKQRLQRATLAASCLSGAIFLELRSSGDAWVQRTRGAAWLSLAAGIFCLQALAPPSAKPQDIQTLAGVVHRVWTRLAGMRTLLQAAENSSCGVPARAAKTLGVEHVATLTRCKPGDTGDEQRSSPRLPLRSQARYQLEEAGSKQRAQSQDWIHQRKDRISVGCVTLLWHWFCEVVSAAQMGERNHDASKSLLHLQQGQHTNDSICRQEIRNVPPQAAQRVRDLPSGSLAMHSKQHATFRPVRDAVIPDPSMSAKGTKEELPGDISRRQKENLQPLRKGLPARPSKGMPGHLLPGTGADSKIGPQGIPAPAINDSATLAVSTCSGADETTTGGTRPKTHQDAIWSRSEHAREPLLALNENNNVQSSGLAGKQDRQMCVVQKPVSGWRSANPFSEIAVRRMRSQAPGEVFVDPEFRSWPQEVAAFIRVCEHADVQHAQVMQVLQKHSWQLQARQNPMNG
ncbi:unnamed protein product [Symbiodinium sp. CCMP2456]|nr:unnamed protein product [Symbiodinium sp. CCMP2456]